MNSPSGPGEARDHWEHVYATKASNDVSWFQAEPTRSLDLLASVGLNAGTRVIDVGGGDSRLVDRLLDGVVGTITVVDLSKNALDRAQLRIGDRSSAVTWIDGDITQIKLPDAEYDLWHDRAVFHFLTSKEERQ
ncbi:MAG: class I SAM-dependent methyltransferase, partial [Gemmatimonadaceae bacterium]